MGAKLKTKLKIGYWPLTKEMDTPGDRRRLKFWARARGHTLVTDLSKKVDLLVASENADFSSKFFQNARVPVVFDLVDAYLSPLNYLDDAARGVAKKLTGQISGGFKPFSHHVRDFCGNATAVICSSIEQEVVIKQFNKNTIVILDSHEEIPFIDSSTNRADSVTLSQILWEGQPATIGGIKPISSILSELEKNNKIHLNLITDQKYYKLLNKYFEGETVKLLGSDFHKAPELFSIVPWTPTNLAHFARESQVAIIPIDLSVPMQVLKPENRLLIMWRLGLPCLTSASPAYSRVASASGAKVICQNIEDWKTNLDRIINDTTYAAAESTKGQDYLRENHSGEILLQKWDIAMESALG